MAEAALAALNVPEADARRLIRDAEQGAPGWEDRMEHIENIADAREELITAARALLIADGAL
ncbi:hypothetical protein [Streptomyces sp. NBC_00009]|uniref:hypothetical protein n=1 Tax=Streptomyces sp. NBC_00009 TaxID=2975620 RepID=UPI00324B12F0